MKKIITSIVIASSLLISAQAIQAKDGRYDRQDPTARLEYIIERMDKNLNLTEEQKSAISEMKKKEFEEIRAIRQQNRQQLESLLTDEQKKLVGDRKSNCSKGEGKRKYKDNDSES